MLRTLDDGSAEGRAALTGRRAGPDERVRRALVLAAGNGDRFRNPTRESKLLQLVLGRPLIMRTIESAREAGITAVEIVLGYQAGRVRAVIEREAPADIAVHFSHNRDWHLQNGVSVLAARGRLRSRFALLMGDHLFEPRVLRRLLRARLGQAESLLGVDSRPTAPEIASEATKVRLRGSRIVAIGKALTDYDALDTGLFVCAPSLFEALESALADGDTTLSGGIRVLAARGLMRAFDIGDATWCDIDTIEDLDSAESLLGGGGEPAAPAASGLV
ncbi:MAG TPA: NTP transferase domain-containing protein [Vicinamibacterales bacterium]|jgi:choline kinase|nr:NTP transferase domain-containing protein [Vicinamibacterales bacterium]